MKRLAFALAVSVLCTGCAADLGTGGGATFPERNAVGIGRVAVSVRLNNSKAKAGWLIGANAEGRGEANVGSRFSMGVSAGYGSGPDLVGRRVGWELFGDFGAPLRGGFTEGVYAGATFQLPIRLEGDRPLRDVNDSVWIFMRRIEVVPFVRTRVHVEPSADESVEVAGGVSGRLRFMSDLL